MGKLRTVTFQYIFHKACNMKLQRTSFVAYCNMHESFMMTPSHFDNGTDYNAHLHKDIITASKLVIIIITYSPLVYIIPLHISCSLESGLHNVAS